MNYTIKSPTELLAEFRESSFPNRRQLAADYDALAARLAEAERLLTRVIVDGDFVSENVLYVYAETFNAIEKFLGRTAWELVKIAADSASGVQK